MPMLRPMRSCCPSTSKSAAKRRVQPVGQRFRRRGQRLAGRDQGEFVAADPRDDRPLARPLAAASTPLAAARPRPDVRKCR